MGPFLDFLAMGLGGAALINLTCDLVGLPYMAGQGAGGLLAGVGIGGLTVLLMRGYGRRPGAVDYSTLTPSPVCRCSFCREKKQ